MKKLLILAILVSTAFCPAPKTTQELPYAQDLIFQSTDTIKTACNEFLNSVPIELKKFESFSLEKNYDAAYQVWSPLLRKSNLNAAPI